MSLSRQPRISVALCTYNGERFLSQQLESINRQTRLPDEVVLCDDLSTDSTIEIAQSFAASAPYPVRIIQNRRTLGSTANFEQAIRLCTGGLIALSDQDDLWFPYRLERSERELQDHPEAGMVFSDAELMDEQNLTLGQTMWNRLGFDGRLRQELLLGRFGILAKHRFITGATVMFRASLRDRVLPVAAGWIHDEWIAGMLAAFADLRPVSEPLIRYRIHGAQLVGLQNKLAQRAEGNTPAEKHWARVVASASELRQMCDALQAMTLPQGRDVLGAYQRHLAFLSFRSALGVSRLRRLGPVMQHYADYRRHASGWRSMAKDIALQKNV